MALSNYFLPTVVFCNEWVGLSLEKESSCFQGDTCFYQAETNEDVNMTFLQLGLLVSRFWANEQTGDRPNLFQSLERIPAPQLSADTAWRMKASVRREMIDGAEKYGRDWKSNWDEADYLEEGR